MIYETKPREKCILCNMDFGKVVNEPHNGINYLNYVHTKTGDNYKKVYKDENNLFEIHNNIGICGYCGLVQTIEPMVEKSLEDFYRKPEIGESEYRKIYPFSEYAALEHLQYGLYFLRVCIQAEIVMNKVKFPIKEILDLGSGNDISLKYFNKTFVDSNIYVYDPGLTSEKSDVLNSIEGKKFDVIFILNVLEHVYDPVRFLRDLKEHLTDEGHIILSVPDVYKILLDTNAWFSGAHIFHFSFETLKKVVIKAGYEIRQSQAMVDHIGGKLFINIKKNDTIGKDFYYKCNHVDKIKDYLYHVLMANNILRDIFLKELK